MNHTIEERLTLETTSCCVCGVSFAIPELMLNQRRKDGQTLYCPNGHSLGWTKTEADKLREQLQEAQKNLTQARCETLNERALRETSEKKLRRVHAGVCPCCKRTFQNLQRHIKTKHPDIAPRAAGSRSGDKSRS